jgi:hypothetical protein
MSRKLAMAKKKSLLNIIGQPHKLARTHVWNVEGLLGVLL